MFKKSKIATSVKLAGALSFAAASLTSSNLVFAQENGADEVIEKISVTGSRIQRTDIETSSPVVSIDAQLIESTGFTRIEDVMNTLPQIEAGQTSFLANGASGTANLDLRGLGAVRTLVLVNGRRLQPGGVYSQASDINQIPTALIKRVDVLTGGGGTVYGADAVAGVVNFVMNDDFDGLQVNVGAQGFQHNNSNDYIQELMDRRNFDYPDGGSGIGGNSYNIDITAGGDFADGKGHVTVFGMWRRNQAMLQGERDYGSCALNGAGTVCGGSETAENPNFYVYDPAFEQELLYTLDPNSNFIPGGQANGNVYNFAPINYFMRPNERFSVGSFVDYELSDDHRFYMETSFMHDQTRAQIAESGTFFAQGYRMDYNNPYMNESQFNTIQQGLGQTADDEFIMFIGKRNVEGGPRTDILEHNSFRIVTGMEGALNEAWSYDVSYQYGSTSSSSSYVNDFFLPSIGPRVGAIGEGACDDDCLPYDVFTFGGVTPEQAQQLSGTAILNGETTQVVYNGFITGEFDFSLPSSDLPVAAVFGFERREVEFSRLSDTLYEEGQLVGQGGPTESISGGFDVNELFGELSVPLLNDVALADSLILELGARFSDYTTSGKENTFKTALDWNFAGDYKFRASFDRAIRAPNVGELFAGQSIGLWGGNDGCAGSDPTFSAAECALTGVSASQYGSISPSPANQYNQFAGGNPNLGPEEADTLTLGLVGNPFEDFNFSIDYWDIEMDQVIGVVGAQRTIQICAETGDPAFCDNIQRNAAGSLWLGQDGLVVNLSDNIGGRRFRGIDTSVNYNMDLGEGLLSFSINGSLNLEKTFKPLTSDSSLDYDCSGTVSVDCFAQPEWRHVASAVYDMGDFAFTARWRYFGEVDYTESTDQLVADGISAYSYIDLSGNYIVNENVSVTAGVNNVFDKAPPLVGGTLSSNANTVAGFYDTLGRMLFVNARLTF